MIRWVGLGVIADNLINIGRTIAAQSATDPAVKGPTSTACDAWAARWRQRLAETPDPDARCAAMRAVNPAYIPRHHLVDAALDAAVARQDFVPFEKPLEVLSRPYEDRPGYEPYI